MPDVKDSELDPIAVLRDLKAWMTHRLEYGPIKHQEPEALHYPQNQHPHGYAGVIVPDWEMKQKLANATESLELCKASGTHAAAGKPGVPVLGLVEQAMLTANALRNIAEEINPDRNDVLRLKSAIEQLHSHADDLMRAVSVEKE